jgi:cytochrome c6
MRMNHTWSDPAQSGRPFSLRLRAISSALGALGALACGLSLCGAPAAQAADIFKGKEIYESYCATCHGVGGQGVMPGVPNFARREGLMRPDQVLYESVRSGKGAMPGYRGILKEREILDVVAYLRTFH